MDLAALPPLAVDTVLYGAYRAAWAFFAYGPQLAICMGFAWSACGRTRGDKLVWLAKGFLWSLLPFVGVAVMWWIWRRASRAATGGAPAAPKDAATHPGPDDATAGPGAGEAPGPGPETEAGSRSEHTAAAEGP